MPVAPPATALRFGALSGGVWGALATILDGASSGGDSFIPWHEPRIVVAAVLGASAIGLAVTWFSHRLLVSWGPASLVLPLATLPIAITLFATTVWGARILLRAGNTPPSWSLLHHWLVIVEAYWVYSAFSVLMPVLYVLAVTNHTLIRRVAAAKIGRQEAGS